MKVLSLLLSIAVFGISIYFFYNDFRFSTEINYLIYMSTLAILICICIVGMLINIPLIRQEKRRMNYVSHSLYFKKNFLKKNKTLKSRSV